MAALTQQTRATVAASAEPDGASTATPLSRARALASAQGSAWGLHAASFTLRLRVHLGVATWVGVGAAAPLKTDRHIVQGISPQLKWIPSRPPDRLQNLMAATRRIRAGGCSGLAIPHLRVRRRSVAGSGQLLSDCSPRTIHRGEDLVEGALPPTTTGRG